VNGVAVKEGIGKHNIGYLIAMSTLVLGRCRRCTGLHIHMQA
jgi:hypothetical protein